MKLIYIIGVSLSLVLSINVCAQSVDLKSGREVIFNYAAPTSDIDFLKKYLEEPTEYDAEKIIHLLKKFVGADSTQLGRWDNFVIFLSIGKAREIVYIREHHKFTLAEYVEPVSKTLLGYRDIWAIWITDSSDYIANSVEVEFEKQNNSFRLSSFESALFNEDLRELPDQSNIDLEIGLKYLENPFWNYQKSTMEITFVRRDSETLERRTWSRSFNVVNRKVLFPPEVGVSVPFTELVNSRPMFISLAFPIQPRETVDERYRYLDYLVPYLILGVGLPIDLGKRDGVYMMAGAGWPFKLGLGDIVIGGSLRGNGDVGFYFGANFYLDVLDIHL